MMTISRQAFPLVAAILFAGIASGAGQAAFPVPAEPPKAPITPGQNPAGTAPAKPAAASSSTLQTKTAPRTPTAAGLGLSSQPAARATAAAPPSPAPASTSTTVENTVRIVRLYRGPGRFDEKLASQLKFSLQKAFGTEPDSKNQAGDHPGSPAGPESGQPKIAQNNVKIN
jgi:hypothetical protein